MLYRMRYPALLFFWFYLLSLGLSGNCFASGTIVGSEPILESAYDVKCDLNYQRKNPYEITSDFEDKYGVDLNVPFETMSLCLTLEGDDKKIMDYLSGLFPQYSFQFAQQVRDDEVWVGLAGDQKTLKKIKNLVKERFHIKDSKVSDIYIDLIGKQIPCWQAIGQIAQKSHLGINGSVSGIYLQDDGREVMTYQEASPFYLYISKDVKTSKLVLDLLYDDKVAPDFSDLKINSVYIRMNGQKQEISGSTLTTMDGYMISNGHTLWMSDGTVKWEEGMVIQGVIQGSVLSREYEVENLSKGESIKGDDLEISVKVSSDFEKVESSSGVGVYFEPEDVDGDWVTVKVNVLGNLNEAEKTFLRMVDKKRQEGKDISENETLRYESLVTEKMHILEVLSMGKPVDYLLPESGEKYGGIYYHNFMNGIDEIQVMFDSMQDGKEIFPLNMQLRKYKPKKIEFSIKVE